MFEDAAHEIDTLMAISLGHMSSGTIPPGTHFQEHVQRLREVTRLKEQADELEDEGDFYDSLLTWRTVGSDLDVDDAQIQAIREEAYRVREKAQQLVNTPECLLCLLLLG